MTKEMEEFASATGRDLSILSDMDWLVSGSNDILGRLAAAPKFASHLPYLHLLPRYSLQLCRDLEILSLTTTA